MQSEQSCDTLWEYSYAVLLLSTTEMFNDARVHDYFCVKNQRQMYRFKLSLLWKT